MTVSGRVIEILSVKCKRLDGLVLCIQVSEKHQVRNFRLPGSAWGLYIKVEHFRINIS